MKRLPPFKLSKAASRALREHGCKSGLLAGSPDAEFVRLVGNRRADSVAFSSGFFIGLEFPNL